MKKVLFEEENIKIKERVSPLRKGTRFFKKCTTYFIATKKTTDIQYHDHV